MKKLINFLNLTSEDIVMIVFALMSFSFGIWTNYRQLWLQNIGFDLSAISKLLSVALICSAIIIFIISFFSVKIKLKNVVMLSIVFRTIALFTMYAYYTNIFIVKSCMLLCVMCENIFAIAIYPLIATINKSDDAYRKHILINYFAKDIAVIFCGLMLGVAVGKVVFSYETCLFLTLISTMLSGIILLLYDENNVTNKKNVLPFKKAIRKLFKSRDINLYLSGQFIAEIAYGIVFGMIMIVLTDYIKFDVSVTSIFIIICNILGSIACSLLNKISKKFSTKLSTYIKYGTRALMYFLAFLINNTFFYILTIAFAYITVRILDDKVNGVFIRKISTNSQFLFGNIRYFVLCIADGIGIYLAGFLLGIGIQYLFLVSAILVAISIIIYNMCSS